MYEQSKAAKRRYNDGAFHARYFVGRGLDIGAGPDGLSRAVGIFPLLKEVRDWDMPDGDAQLLAGVADGSYDFVHASHCLEHMVDARVALANWIRVTRPGGYLVIMVPDEDMYERGQWPSRFNSDHKWSFTACKRESWAPKSINVVDLVSEYADQVELERLQVVRDFFRPEVAGDQTGTPVAECAIELVLRRRPDAAPGPVLHGAATSSLIPPIGRNRLQSCRRGLMLVNMQDSNVARLLDTYGEYSEAEVALFAQIVSAGDTVVEAGANIGALAVPLGRLVGPTGTVHAFEPQEHVWRHLVANVTLNELDNVRCWNAAVGDAQGTIEVPRIGPNTAHSFGSVALDPERRDAACDASRGIAVPLMTIDQLELPRCRLIKADVEGMEASVLRGARETIARCRPVLYLEADQKDSIAALREAIAEIGYSAHWHVVPYVGAANFYKRPVEFFRGIVAVNILAAPPGLELKGGKPVVSNDWRADHAA